MRYDLMLPGGAAAALLAMTPYHWRAPPERRAAVATAVEMTVTVDILVARYLL